MSEAERLFDLVSGTHLFGVLPVETRRALSRSGEERTIAAGSLLIAAGELAKAVFVVATGRGEEWVESDDGAVPVSLVGPGDVAGEEALQTSDGAYATSLKAIEPMRVLVLPLDELRAHLEDPGLRSALAEEARMLERVLFIRKATPFSGLPPGAVRALAETVTLQGLDEGEVLVHEGEAGESCFLIREGRFAVRKEGAEDVVATLGPGELVGEVALLAGEPHRATVTASGPGRVLVLRRPALLEALAGSSALTDLLTMKARLRLRPVRAEGIEAYETSRADGEAVTVLKNPARGGYLRLTELGTFIWQRLDGAHTVRTLVMERLRAGHGFAPAATAEIVSALIAGGFATSHADPAALGLARRADAAAGRGSWIHRIAFGMVVERDAKRADAIAGRLFRLLAPFTRTSNLLWLSGLCIAGLILMIAGAIELWGAGTGWPAWLTACVALLACLVLHEIGHMLAVKANGRAVNGYGLGWYWGMPFGFVDTTDIWFAPRRAQIAVSLAGPFVNLLLASVAAMAGTATTDGFVQALAWPVVVANLVIALSTLSPSGANDGAVALEDWLGPPRWRGFAGLAHVLGALAGRPDERRALTRADLVFAAALIVHAVAVAAVATVFYNVAIGPELEAVTGAALGAWLGAGFAIVCTVLASGGVATAWEGETRVSPV